MRVSIIFIFLLLLSSCASRRSDLPKQSSTESSVLLTNIDVLNTEGLQRLALNQEEMQNFKMSMRNNPGRTTQKFSNKNGNSSDFFLIDQIQLPASIAKDSVLNRNFNVYDDMIKMLSPMLDQACSSRSKKVLVKDFLKVDEFYSIPRVLELAHCTHRGKDIPNWSLTLHLYTLQGNGMTWQLTRAMSGGDSKNPPAVLLEWRKKLLATKVCYKFEDKSLCTQN